jgi:hypothetical protein
MDMDVDENVDVDLDVEMDKPVDVDITVDTDLCRYYTVINVINQQIPNSVNRMPWNSVRLFFSYLRGNPRKLLSTYESSKTRKYINLAEFRTEGFP